MNQPLETDAILAGATNRTVCHVPHSARADGASEDSESTTRRMSGNSPAGSGQRHPGLDGLRGVAVALIVAFHLWPATVRGGWLGVGLFFTLSGYLIFGLIHAELASTGRFRLGRFMARRVRRLMPAALVTVVATLALTAVLDDQAIRAVGFDAVNPHAAVLNVFNWRTASDPGGYAAIFSLSDLPGAPLDHFWSLAIEEQFYLIVPAALALTRRPVVVLGSMAAIGVGGVALWWGSVDAYVATPVRGLEIAAGAALAVAATRFGVVRSFGKAEPGSRRAQAVGSVATVTAAGLAGWAVLGFDPNHPAVFRGGPQLMALCWVVLVAASLRGGLLDPLLSAAPLRWLGTRSFAVYLFHWPLVELTDWGALPVIAVTLIAAELSYRLIEMPIRRGTGRAVPVLVAVAAAVAATAGAVAAASTPARAVGERTAEFDELPAWTASSLAPVNGSATAGFDELPTEAMSSTARVNGIPTAGFDELPAWIPAGPSDAPRASSDKVSTVPIITVVGDSTAVHIADGLRRWADANRLIGVVDHSVTGCSPLAHASSSWRQMRGYNDERFQSFPPGAPCRRNYVEPGSTLVLVVDHGTPMHDHEYSDGSWRSIVDDDFSSDLAEAYRQLVYRSQTQGARVIFTTAPRILVDPRFEPGHPMQDPQRTEIYNALVQDLVSELEPAGVSLIDTATWLDAGGRDGPYPRRDGLHIDFDYTEAFAAEVVGPATIALLGD